MPRYQTMRGRRVERRFGWDCHGLPAEMEAEKELGLSGRPAIVEYGVDRFNEACRTSVLRYTNEWERYVTRQARWVDFDNDYKTLDLPYMESVMWAFKHAVGQGPASTRATASCRTAGRARRRCRNTETRHGRRLPGPPGPGAHRLVRARADRRRPAERILAWTTTPWTLPSNLALAVGPDIDYAVIEEDGQRYVLAEARRRRTTSASSPAPTRVGTVKGAELVGRRYTPLFPFFADQPNAFRVLAADFVTTEDGTGVVHMAPGFGEDDQNVCEANGIDTVVPVDAQGRFTAEVEPWAGMHVFDANPPSSATSRTRGRVVRHETLRPQLPALLALRHSRSSTGPCRRWFVQVTAFKDRMVELNQQITWVPEHVRDGSFGKWLANARDWSISRNRFWGSPIPVWKSDDPALPARSTSTAASTSSSATSACGRPTCTARCVDELVRPNPDDPTGQSMMRRVPEVLDCWFESGSMPFAQVHYPFENQEWFEAPLPGRLHRRVHRPDPRLVLHAARAGDGAVRPAGVPDLRRATASCSATTARSCRSACATTPTRSRCSTRTAPTRCAGSCCRRPSCGAATSS